MRCLKLRPQTSHRTNIRKIVARLGLDPDGDISNTWVALCGSFGEAHRRSFHRSLKVDDDFRAAWQQPFDLVIRTVAIALQGKYAAFMRRVDQIARMSDKAQAISLFEKEIPGALPLQRHFFQQLEIIGVASASHEASANS